MLRLLLTRWNMVLRSTLMNSAVETFFDGACVVYVDRTPEVKHPNMESRTTRGCARWIFFLPAGRRRHSFTWLCQDLG